MKRLGWLVLLWLPATAAFAHLSGFTDTSIQIAQAGVKVIYTVPADNLLELDGQQPLAAAPGPAPGPAAQTAAAAAAAKPKEPAAYLNAIANGWSVQALRRECFQKSAEAKALEAIPSYQYILVYECPQGFEGMLIRYTLFGEQWRGEQNFTRVLMAGEQLRMRFTFDKKELTLDVPALLKEWGKPMARDFLTLDPNRRLRKEAWTGFANDDTPQEPTTWWQSLKNADPAFVSLGMKHILSGADHVLFVVGLLLVPAGWARLAGLITSFTAAHSITLSLSALSVFSLPPSLTEPLIALTVAAIGVENIVSTRWRNADAALVAQIRTARSYRWLVTFGFGLIHGIGLSYVLSEMGMGDDLAGTLLFFNLGVELGQLCVLAVCLPLTIWIFRQPWGLKASSALSALLALAGLGWFVERVLA